VKPRRIVAGALLALGAILMFAAPGAEPLGGAIVMGLGVLVEIAGIAFERRQKERGR
jgi:hypothetical protein